jgi:hypothetical protein
MIYQTLWYALEKLNFFVKFQTEPKKKTTFLFHSYAIWCKMNRFMWENQYARIYENEKATFMINVHKITMKIKH